MDSLLRVADPVSAAVTITILMMMDRSPPLRVQPTLQGQQLPLGVLNGLEVVHFDTAPKPATKTIGLTPAGT